MRTGSPLFPSALCAICTLRPTTSKRSYVFRVPHNRATAIEPQPTIFTGWTAPVIRKADDGARAGAAGLRSYRMAAPRRVTNVRDDRILTSRFWKPSFEQRRCLVPASSYCEPDSGKPVKWLWFAVNGDEDRRIFAFPRISCRTLSPQSITNECRCCCQRNRL